MLCYRIRRTVLAWAVLMLATGPFAAGTSFAQAPVPFDCTGQAFTVRFSPGQLFSIDQSVSPFTFTPIGGTAQLDIGGVLTDIELNNLGFRSTDGLLYAMALKLFVPNNSAANGNYGIVAIDSTGTVFPVAIPAPSPIPGFVPGFGNNNYRFPAGDVTPDGSTMYVNAQVTSNASDANRRLYIVDLTAAPITATFKDKTRPAGFTVVNVADWAVSPVDGLLYGASYTGQIFSMDPTTSPNATMATVTSAGFLPGGSAGEPLDAYGGAWFDADGHLFAYRNVGEIYEVDLTGPTIVSTQVGGPSSNFNDAAACALQIASIDVEKSVSVDGGTTYHEADDPTGPTATVGNDVYFEFVVTNTGTVTLSNVALTDPDYDLSGCAVPMSLAPGEAFTCVIGPITALADQQTNTATATGDFGADTVSASDPANYFGAQISIDLEKSVSVDNQVTFEDADVTPGPTATVGDDVYFKLLVTNTSNVKLHQISLSDSVYDLSGCTIPSSLDPGESFSCLIGPLSAMAGQQTNTATAGGENGGLTTAATDDANYFGANLSLTLEKSVSVDGGVTYHDADVSPGPTVTAGNDLYFSFLVTNTSNVTLSDITLTDPDYDLSGCSVPSSLAPGDSFSCVLGPITALSDEQVNTASASGSYEGQTASVTDPAYYFGAAISLDLEKSVSVDGGATYLDADETPGPETLWGSDVYFLLEVTNTSNVPLVSISLTDPDYDLSGCTIPASLEPGEWFSCVIGPFMAELGAQLNTATVSASDASGNPTSTSDPANYFGGVPEIGVEKSVSADGGATYHDADEAPGPTVTTNGDVFYRFLVTNTGNVTLSEIGLTDPQYDLSGCVLPDSLAAGDSFACELGPFPANSGLSTNTATATGAFDGQTYSDSDPANYTGVPAGNPSIDIEKSVSVDGGVTYEDADAVSGPLATPGGDIYFKLSVTNTGNVELTNITLTDPDYDLSGCTIPDILLPGESFYCVVGPITALAGQQTNTAAATGESDGRTATASDPAYYYGGVGAIDVEKFVCLVDGPVVWEECVDADEAPGPDVIAGSLVRFLFLVMNTGDVALSNITLSDTVFDLSGCTVTDPLGPGDSFYCETDPFVVDFGSHVDTATATGDYDGQTATDSDSAHIAISYWAFTPGFWKNNTTDKGKQSHDAWKYTQYGTGVLLGEVFEATCLDDYAKKRKTYDQFTLLQALGFRGGTDTVGALEILLRAAAASLLNASFHETMGNPIGVDGVYPYTTQEVIDLVNAAICSGDRDTMLLLYVELDAINNGIHYIDWSWPAP